MRLKRKVLALVTTASMVLGLFGGVASAGTFSDVPADKSYAGAVERLAGLGVVQGVGGGKYDPEGQYTRAQFAAAMVKLRGIKNPGTGGGEFKDVPSSHWAAGWISLASNLGIIKGMGDGTFRPDDPVTHAQALTMILRVMGYEPVLKKGNWPGVVLAKATELGLDKNVNVVPNLPATRAEVAVMTDNALNVPLMVVTGIDSDGKETYGQALNDDGTAKKSILKTYLKATAVEGTVTSGPEVWANSKDQPITLTPASDVDLGNGKGSAKAYKVVTGTNTAGFLGKKVKAYLDPDGKIFAMEVLTDAANVKTDTVKDKSGTSFKLKDADKTVNITASTLVFTNGVERTVNKETYLGNGDEVQVVLDGSNALAIVATRYTSDIIDSVDADGKTVSLKGDSVSLDLSSSDYSHTIIINGKLGSFADLKKDDVVQYYEQDPTNHNKGHYIVVTRNTSSGTLNRVSKDSDGNLKVQVGSTTYTLAGDVRLESGGSVNSNVTETDVNAQLGGTVTVMLNKSGKVSWIRRGTATTTNEQVVVVRVVYYTSGVDANGNPVYYMPVLKTNGDKVGLRIASKASLNGGPVTDVDASNIANYVKADKVAVVTVKDDGSVDSVRYIHETQPDNYFGSGNYQDKTSTDVTVDKDNHRVDGKLVTTGTIIFQQKGAGDWAAITRADIEANSTIRGFYLVDKDFNARMRILAMTQGNALVASNHGWISDRWTESGGKTKLTIWTGGSSGRDVELGSVNPVYKLTWSGGAWNAVADAAYANDITSGAAIATALSGSTVSGTVYIMPEYLGQDDGFTGTKAYVKERNDTDKYVRVKVTNDSNQEQGSQWFVVNSDTIIIDNTGDAPKAATFDSLAVGKKIKVFEKLDSTLKTPTTGIAAVIVLVK